MEKMQISKYLAMNIHLLQDSEMFNDIYLIKI